MTSALIDSDTGQAQDVLLALVEQSQDCVKILDLAGNLQFMNGFGRQAMGIADFDSVKGREWALLWPEDARDRVRKAVAGAAGGHSARFEEPCPGAGDTLIWWDVNLSPVTAADGERTHIVATSIMGIGAADNPRAVRWKKAKDIAVTWVVTIPGAALVAIQAYALLNLYLGSKP